MLRVNHYLRCIGLATLIIASGTACAAVVITGTGSSAFQPIYGEWANAYEKLTGINVDYDSTGSNNGVIAVRDKAVSFGASDVPVSQKDLVKNGLLQFPTLIEGVVPVVNLGGITKGQLKLSGRVLADIFLGKISKWDDVKIAADNQGVKLPNQQINVAYRADNSGTTLLFTTYLSQVSAEWKSTIGAGRNIPWKTGKGVNLSEGMSTYVKNTSGSIGYVSYGIAMHGGLNTVQLKTHEGNFIKPSVSSFKAAYLGFEASKCFCEPMINQPGKDTWPIASTSFILIRNTAGSQEVLNFFEWAFDNGEQIANGLGYSLLPQKTNKVIINFTRNLITH